MRQEQSNKLRRYEKRTEQYVQNRMFKRLKKENRSNDIRPGSQESVRFWGRIWDQPVTQDDEAKWLTKVDR